MAIIYFILAVLGALFPYAAFGVWLVENGLNVSLLLADAMANPISMMAWLDVIIAGVALIVFIVVDGKDNNVRLRGWAIAGTLTIGVAFGLPFYLFLKESNQK
ncbi:DUF2834 domain-containing protein [Grimontia sp. NTOU-MAR1]|uniref:DUF2834 domain-containing protein n=1 Tax=Grimontia sp. NTOU-MAR1 TaxID=3111011 RepID=UPI002DC05A71|nr:DUF2834 domain-containing protein [Grimontia sp. NTOU-MAR1]WRW01052.1 DUF2834 domain-containing protein [Grimontia sp. NTOU-MAR1]